MQIKFILLVLLSLSCYSIQCQDQQTIEGEEGKLLRLINAMRSNPKAFLKEVVRPYSIEESLDTVNNKYVSGLFKNLSSLKPMGTLKESAFLKKKARAFASDMGETGATGHYSKKLGSMSQRLDKYKGNATAENCSYGFSDAIGILMQLLIDEDVPSLGHRKNLLNKEYNEIGLAIEAHTKYEWNCVMDFGKAGGGKAAFVD